MNAKRSNDYYVGLDMGTGSLGVAVTDTNYNLLKIKGKDFWFVREFETAHTQVDRRNHRIAKRRLQRHQTRIGLIRSYFADDVLAHDPQFFVRQDNSKYYMEDKDACLSTADCLFADEDYRDKDYHKEFATIFHLRQRLIRDDIECEERYSRYLYLAIINMFEHRGHFLLNSTSDDVNSDMVQGAGEKLINYLMEASQEIVNEVSLERIVEIMSDKKASRSVKKEKLVEAFGLKKSNKLSIEIIKCLCGMEADARIMFGVESDEKVKVAFQQASFEDEVDAIQSTIGDEYFEVVDSMKQIYDYSQLQSILKGYEYLSDARVQMYKDHAEDLDLLKQVYKDCLSEKIYNTMFRSSEDGTYSAYVNSLNSTDSLTEKTKYRRNMKKRGKDELYARIKKDLKGINDERVNEIFQKIELEQFLPKQLTGSNGIIPNQIHRKELKKILENAEKHLEFLSEKDESGLTVSERILSLFSYNIPYYIGPVGKNSNTGWVERLEEGQVLPWNIEQKIHVDATSEKFITNLIRKCTYLSGEKVLPKQSLLYERFCVLNEINNLKINGKRIVPKLKQEIYTEVFQGSRLGKKVTKSRLCSYLVNRGIISDESELSGIDKEINASLSSYGKMYAVFGERLREDSVWEAAEDIIYYGTIYGDSKKMFRKNLLRHVESGLLDEGQVKRIMGYKFKDWARLSKEFLHLAGCDKSTGKAITLIRAMWDCNLNLMELINSDDFTFKKELEDKKINIEKNLSEFQYDDLEEYYYSAPVKRMIWQAVLSLKEITKIMGHNPKRIFIEMTRTDEEKGEQGRKSSREKHLLNLYENIKDERPWDKEIKKASESGILNSKKIYLYYLQMGKDAYTGEDIDIEDLFTDNKYDIDHIYPRSITDDNNIENNLVLVSKTINEDVKKDGYPLPESVRNNPKVRELWSALHKMGKGNEKLMNDEKYHRLTSNEPLSDEKLAGFIARQLVETAQGTKGIADLFKGLMPDTEIVYTKARNVSDFRKQHHLLKSRLVNEFHHAQDAYLNIVVGNVYYTKFTSNPLKFIKNEVGKDRKKYAYNLYKMFSKDVIRNGEVAWIAQNSENSGTIQLVKKVVCKTTPIITRQSFVQKGELFNLQPKSKYEAKHKNYIPVKTKDVKMADVTKYGGYTSLTPAYFVFLEHGEAKKRKRCFEMVQSYSAIKIHNVDELVRYFEEKGYKNPRIISDKIKKNALVKYNGYYLYIVGMDAGKRIEFSNATAMCLRNNFVQYIAKLEKAYLEITVAEKKKKIHELPKMITKEQNLDLYQELKHKQKESIFKNHPKSIGKCMDEGESAFKILDIEQQVKLLHNIIKYTSFQKGSFSLAEIGGPKDVGRIRISGNMTNAKELKLVNYSVSGMMKEEVDLLKN